MLDHEPECWLVPEQKRTLLSSRAFAPISLIRWVILQGMLFVFPAVWSKLVDTLLLQWCCGLRLGGLAPAPEGIHEYLPQVGLRCWQWWLLNICISSFKDNTSPPLLRNPRHSLCQMPSSHPRLHMLMRGMLQEGLAFQKPFTKLHCRKRWSRSNGCWELHKTQVWEMIVVRNSLALTGRMFNRTFQRIIWSL